MSFRPRPNRKSGWRRIRLGPELTDFNETIKTAHRLFLDLNRYSDQRSTLVLMVFDCYDSDTGYKWAFGQMCQYNEDSNTYRGPLIRTGTLYKHTPKTRIDWAKNEISHWAHLYFLGASMNIEQAGKSESSRSPLARRAERPVVQPRRDSRSKSGRDTKPVRSGSRRSSNASKQ